MLRIRNWQAAELSSQPAAEKLYGHIEKNKWSDCGWNIEECFDECFGDCYDDRDEAELRDALHDLMGSSAVQSFYKNLDYDDQILLSKTNQIDIESAHWGYGGNILTPPQTLFPVTAASKTIPVATSDLFVLTGILGRSIMKDDKTIAKLSKRLEVSELNKAIAVGGAALAAVNHRSDWDGAAQYGDNCNNGLSDVVEIGGSMNGDLRISRFTTFDYAVDPIGNKRLFAPALPEEIVLAYHSTEPYVLNHSVLQLINAFGPVKAAETIHQILEETADIQAIAGPFGDYGADATRFHSMKLQNDIERSQKFGFEKILPYLISPEVPYISNAKTVGTGDSGLRFATKETDGNAREILTIPNEELPDFITTLIRQQGGRTSPYSLRKMLKAVLESL
jgi:hypothetical protein